MERSDFIEKEYENMFPKCDESEIAALLGKEIKDLKICVLDNDLECEAEYNGVDECTSLSEYLPDVTIEQLFLKKATSKKVVSELVARNEFDVFWNFCDGGWNEGDRAGIEVIETLSELDVCAVSPNVECYEPSKEDMKNACERGDIPTAKHQFAYCEADVELALTRLKFPMIVKHFNGSASIGMTENSRCVNSDALRKEAMRFITVYGGALIEEFIEGGEYSCLVYEMDGEIRAFWPVQTIFPPGVTFKHFQVKWIDYQGFSVKPVESVEVAHEIMRQSRKLFSLIGGESYARCDLRGSAENGNVFMLEINPACGLFLSMATPATGDHILSISLNKFGFGPRQFALLMIADAFRKSKRRQKEKMRPVSEKTTN